MNKISQWFRKLTSTGEVPTSVGTVIELTESKMIVSVNGNNYAFPLPNEKRVEIHDRVLVDSISESVIEIIPHKNVAPIGTLYDNKRGFPFPFTMDDIAGMDDIKERIKQEICLPFSDEEHIKLAKMLKISPPSGLLLEGPPGCGKTMLASAIAEYMKLPMLTITSSDVISSLIGESSQNVAKIFRYCREHAPIILFIDEIESLSPKRGQERETGEIDRFYTQLLIELDGINARNTKKKYNIEKNVPNTEEN
ncbi:MAG: AAA family ATPase, partial [Candidatus Helarchaeota archaeon]